jgi:NMD protein affecting ribosome stability and mRNA decay
MICVKCGLKETISGGLCEDCIWDTIDLKKPPVVTKTVCPKCDSIMVGNYWAHREPEETWIKHIQKMFSVNEPFKIESFSDMILNNIQDRVKISVFIKLFVDSKEYGPREYADEFDYRRNFISCPTCNKVTGSYFEAKVQIRSFSEKISPELEEMAKNLVALVEKHHERDPNSFISKVVNMKEGIDVYLGKKKDGDTFAHDTVAKNVCQLVVSNSLAGIKDGKQFFRFTYRIRVLDIREGAIIYIDKEKYIYFGKSSSGVWVRKPGSREDKLIRKGLLEFDRIRDTGERAELEKFLIVTREGDEMTLMNTRNFEQVTVKGKQYLDYNGDEIELLKYEDQFYDRKVVT